MSANGKRVRKPKPYLAGKDAALQPGDEVVGEYSGERLVTMDRRFVERVERAIAAGEGSAATHSANASRPR
jgi:hypothetical protein